MRYLPFVALLALSAPALAEETAAPAKEQKEKKVCRRDVNTESILPRSVCRTKTEWSKIDAAKQKQTNRDTDAMRNRGTTGGLDGGRGAIN